MVNCNGPTVTPPPLISTPWYSANVVYPRCQSVR